MDKIVLIQKHRGYEIKCRRPIVVRFSEYRNTYGAYDGSPGYESSIGYYWDTCGTGPHQATVLEVYDA